MGTNANDATRVMDATRHLVRALAGSARTVETETGITGAQLFILRQLADADGPLSVNELAARTLTHQSTVSGVVGRLVAGRLVTRAPAPDDARRVAVSLAARGRRLLASAPPSVQTQLVTGLARLTAAERLALADLFEAWLAEAGLGGEPAPLFFEADDRRSARPPRRARAAAREGRHA